MKIMNGYWVPGTGYKTDYAAQAYEVTTTPHSITVLATTQVIRHRGMTLTGPNLEITYSSTAKDVIKVHIAHFKGTVDNRPRFELNEDQGYTPTIRNEVDFAELVSGDTRLVIAKGESWNVEYFYKDKRLTGAGWRSTTYVKENAYQSKLRVLAQAEDNFFDFAQDPRDAYVLEKLDLGVGECIYGFGEKFTTFVKNGQNVEVWNADGGTCTEQSYKSIPFYLSSNGYGILVNSSDRVSFEVGSEVVSKVSFAIPGEELEYFIIGGADLKEVLVNYTTLSGKPALPPAYSFGLWLSTSFTTNYNEETVNSFIDGMAERDIPLQVFHFDCFWMKEHEWCNMEWDTRQFPDPQGMLGRLKAKGLEICVWINPYVGQRSKLFDIGVKNGYFIKKPDGSVFQTDFWQPGMAIVDFTNPEACKWYGDLLKTLFQMGIRNIKTDFGERIPTNVVYHGGQDPIQMHNYYTYLYNKTVVEALEDFYGKNETCLFSRSATVGGQKYPVHWGGDCFASYSAMAETIRAGLSLCSSGFGFFSHDIGGFEATATPDLYKRWCAFGLLSTHSRLHGSGSYRVPWLFDDEASDVLRFYTKLKGRLMPYLFAQAVHTHETGVPMMRSMVVEFTGDTACKYLDTQYMLGDSLLIAPVMNDRGIAEFYVPDGLWTDIVTGDTYTGGRYYTRQCSYTEMPILARENSIIGFGAFGSNVVYDYVDGAEFVIYGIQDGAEATVDVYDSNAQKALTITAVRKGNTVTVTGTPTDKPYTVRLATQLEATPMPLNGAPQVELVLN
ncbi:alpha-xylosidase [Ruminococcaceae bacterium OttesenSCG-928-L11]|nr:alpha-xylosidase [Ruminococcaceae bacterium OttesenSCG-928-L11]